MMADKDLKQFIIFSIILSITSIVNCFFYSNKIIMYVFVALQIIFLFIMLIKEKYMSYYCYYCGFVSLSLEFPEFVGSNFYGMKSIRIFGVNLAVLLILPLLVFLAFDKKKKQKPSPTISSFYNYFLIFVVFAFASGVFCFLINDNGIRDIASLSTFLDAMYPYLFIFFCFLSLYLLHIKRCFKIQQLENALFGIIVAIAITMCFSLVFKNYGVYGGINTLQVSTLSMALPCALIVFIYKDINIKKRMVVFTAALIITLLSLMFNANGKIVLSIGVSVLFFLYVSFKKRKMLFFASIIIMPIVLIVGLIVMKKMISNSFLLQIKVEQAISTVSFWKHNWFENMSESPKFRIEEFLTIIDEYIKKPWMSFFGKGFLGTTKDNLGYYLTATETSFSDFELKNRVYYNMHESLNNLFLTGGLFGLVFFMKYLFVGIKSSKSTFWGILGTFWFALFFRYSVTIGVFGISVFVLSLLSLEKNMESRCLYGYKVK